MTLGRHTKPTLAALLGLPIFKAFAEKNPRSHALSARAVRVMPDGVSSGTRWFPPFPIHVDRAQGAYKWTVDGQRLVDFWMGHSALLLGHGEARIRAAIERQLARGLHYAAPHELEVELAERICSLVPHAEQVRFVGTGSEATSLALRIARAATGRTRLLRFRGHYHGWYDSLMYGVLPPYDNRVPGTSLSAADEVVVAPLDPAEVEQRIAQNDIAAVMLEPTGGSAGALPLPPEFLAALRKSTLHHGVPLIFDEIISGFRFAPGGAARFYGVEPDLSTFSKALFSGMPGAAVAGRRELMDRLSFRLGGGVGHQGTWNGAPLAMAAGNECLEILKDGEPQARAAATASVLRSALRRVLEEKAVVGAVYGDSSLVHVAFGPTPKVGASSQELRALHEARIDPGTNVIFRCSMLLEGVDFFTSHGSAVSAAHSEADVAATVLAFRYAVENLLEAGLLSSQGD